jgi:hypothetical protein
MILNYTRRFCRVHKNQAVNLLQIPIHAQDAVCFLISADVKINKIRITTEFEPSGGYDRGKKFIAAIAAKFLQSESGIFLQKRSSASKNNNSPSFYPAGIKGVR